MKQYCLVVLALIALFCFSGCGNNNESTGIQGITFADKGAVVPNPIITTAAIDSNTIKYSQTQAGQAIAGWSKQIQYADYTSIQKVLTNYNLFDSGNVTLPTGQQACTGGSGMTITITKSNNVHSFDISGDILCNRSLWPEGVRNLVNLEDALIAKYTTL